MDTDELIYNAGILLFIYWAIALPLFIMHKLPHWEYSPFGGVFNSTYDDPARYMPEFDYVKCYSQLTSEACYWPVKHPNE